MSCLDCGTEMTDSAVFTKKDRQLVEGAKRIVTGGPQSRAAVLGAAEADLGTLINATIFDHPALATFLDRIPRRS
jgi:hypothetical protein